jgi:hypothetical protein
VCPNRSKGRASEHKVMKRTFSCKAIRNIVPFGSRACKLVAPLLLHQWSAALAFRLCKEGPILQLPVCRKPLVTWPKHVSINTMWAPRGQTNQPSDSLELQGLQSPRRPKAREYRKKPLWVWGPIDFRSCSCPAELDAQLSVSNIQQY